MTMTIAAIYEKGVLRLMQPIELPEGTSVEIIVIPKTSHSQPKSPADVLAEILRKTTISSRGERPFAPTDGV